MSDALNELDVVLDSESWEFLNSDENYIPIANVVKKLVDKGVMPDTIRKHVLQRLGQNRAALAQRCENAARFLYSQKSKT